MRNTRYLPVSLTEISNSDRVILEDFTVLIPTLGRPLLEKCLISIVDSTAWPASVVVVDQGTNPAVATWIETIQKLGIETKYMRSSERGAGASRNRCIERINTRFAAATDEDCIVAPDWLACMADQLRRHPTDIITGRVEPGSDEGVPSTITSTVPAVYDKPQFKADRLYTGNMGFALETAERIGPFDEDPRLFPAEDNDWGYRALCAGIPIRYAPEVVLVHLGWRDAGQRQDLYRRYARAQGFFYGKHIGRGDLFICLRAARDLLRGPLRWTRGIVKGDADMRASGCASTTHLLPGIAAGLWRESHL
jgi:GT2 family glycosyltransferase